MKLKPVSGIMLTLLLTSMLTLAFNIQPVRAGVIIYIRPDGSVWGTDKIQRDGDLYTFTNNIYDISTSYGIVVEKDNIVVDGAGNTLQGTGAYLSIGIILPGRSNVTIKNIEIKAFWNGIVLGLSSNNSVSGNNITANINYGIWLERSSNNILRGNNITNNVANFAILALEPSEFVNDVDASNTVDGKPIYYWVNKQDMDVPSDAGYVTLVNCTRIKVQNLNLTNNGQGVLMASTTNSTITKNNVTNNMYGIELYECSNNSVYENNIRANKNLGIGLMSSSNNIFHHNNFINNTNQVYPSSTNAWDNGTEGNYWSNYTSVDANGDGIGDTPYVINENNTDRYPLMKPWSHPSAEEVPFWMQWWFWTIVTTVIVASAGVVYFSKKRKKQLLPCSLSKIDVSSKNSIQNQTERLLVHE